MNIVILSQPRTGSNLLSRVLGNFPPFRELSEFFITESDAKNVDQSILPYNVFLSNSEFDVLKYLLKTDTENFLNVVHKDINHTIHKLDLLIPHTKIFKIQNHQITDIQLKTLLDNPTLKFIVLERKDKLKQYASNVVAGKVKQFFSNIKININVDEFNKFNDASIKWYINLRQMLTEKNINFLNIVYEDDLEFIDEVKLAEKIKTWLNQVQIPYSKYSSRPLYFFKQNNQPIEETILNFRELK